MANVLVVSTIEHPDDLLRAKIGGAATQSAWLKTLQRSYQAGRSKPSRAKLTSTSRFVTL